MPETVRHPLFARLYVLMSPGAERAGFTGLREETLEGLSGRVIEVGAGHGLNFRHYPETVTEVVAVEPEPYLRKRALAAAKGAPVPVRVVAATAEQLPGGNGTFDAAVFSLVLCTVRDQQRALDELRRVLRPGGELRFLEHVVADTPGLARVQRWCDRRLWPLMSGGCRCGLDTAAGIRDAGFAIERMRRLRFDPCCLAVLTSPCILGRARAPA